jgi:hypothetical protein
MKSREMFQPTRKMMLTSTQIRTLGWEIGRQQKRRISNNATTMKEIKRLCIYKIK